MLAEKIIRRLNINENTNTVINSLSEPGANKLFIIQESLSHNRRVSLLDQIPIHIGQGDRFIVLFGNRTKLRYFKKYNQGIWLEIRLEVSVSDDEFDSDIGHDLKYPD